LILPRSDFDFAPPDTVRCHPELVELRGIAPKFRGRAEWDLRRDYAQNDTRACRKKSSIYRDRTYFINQFCLWELTFRYIYVIIR
jgi:hypothetical protein